MRRARRDSHARSFHLDAHTRQTDLNSAAHSGQPSSPGPHAPGPLSGTSPAAVSPASTSARMPAGGERPSATRLRASRSSTPGRPLVPHASS
jgi:hypothetical protein